MGTLLQLLAGYYSAAYMDADEPIRRGVRLGLKVVGDTANNDRPDSPEHLQHLRRWSSQSHRHNLRTVGRCIGDENAPRDAFQDLRREEHALTVAEIEDEDEGVQGHETANGCPSISNFTGNGTCNKDTNEGTNWSATLEC